MEYYIRELYTPTDKEAQEIKEIFKSNHWHYSASLEIEEIKSIFQNATYALACYSEGKIVAIVRVLDDGCWQANIDCLLVHTDFQHKGIGTALVEDTLRKLKDVKYKNVCTNDLRAEEFWKKQGFKEMPGKFFQRED